MWPVPDIVCFLLMEKFYHSIAQGLKPSMALQEAQNEIRKMTVDEIKNRLIQQKKLIQESKSEW